VLILASACDGVEEGGDDGVSDELELDEEDEGCGSAAKLAVMVPDAVTVAVVPLACGLAMFIPDAVVHDENL